MLLAVDLEDGIALKLPPAIHEQIKRLHSTLEDCIAMGEHAFLMRTASVSTSDLITAVSLKMFLIRGIFFGASGAGKIPGRILPMYEKILTGIRSQRFRW